MARRFALGIVALVLLAACSSSASRAHDTTSTSASPPISSPRGADGLPIVTFATAFPHPEVLTVSPHVGPGMRFVATSVMGDRPVLLGSAHEDPRPKPQPDQIAVGGIGFGALDAATGRFTMLHRFSSSRFSGYSADSAGDWVVWVENDTATAGTPHWAIWSADLRTAQATQVATYRAHSPSNGDVQPFINDDGLIAWSADDENGRTNIYTVPISGGTPKVVLQDARITSMAGSLVTATKLVIRDEKVETPHLMVVDLRSGATHDVPDTEGVGVAITDGTRLVWIEGTNRKVVTADMDGRHRTVLDAGRTPQFPSVGKRAIAWDGYEDGPMVVLNGTNRIVKLVEQRQIPVQIKGEYLFWTVRDGATFESPFTYKVMKL